ncbi:hypothetical protein AAFF_G00007070 [Aldrovandia affinis]|uniref:Uncharacterized protein n=1 Tax=Aldrovandia affinis TaxID=143900 RepID=A0AAD7T5W7_9TELE|nr:hypothetical protein AAFF_G00007070 [Aldrovandia affinis]
MARVRPEWGGEGDHRQPVRSYHVRIWPDGSRTSALQGITADGQRSDSRRDAGTGVVPERAQSAVGAHVPPRINPRTAAALEESAARHARAYMTTGEAVNWPDSSGNFLSAAPESALYIFRANLICDLLCTSCTPNRQC